MLNPRSLTYALLFLLLFASACFGDLASGALSEPNAIDTSATEASGTTDTTEVGTIGSSTDEVTSDVSATTTEGNATEDTTTDTDSTTDEPEISPVIEDVSMTPNPIFANGSIGVTVMVTDADGVTMKLDDGSVELTPAGDGVFEGEILALSGIDNGNHGATLIAFRADNGTEDVRYADYDVSLPDPGAEGFWETGDNGTGPGQVRALGVIPTGVVEFGTFAGNGISRCYLRRRDKGGSWGPDDLLEVLPGIDCEAIDLEVGADGELFLLMRRYSQGGWLWWLAEMPSWGADLDSRGSGTKEEAAHALALHGTTLAVCGSAPTNDADLSDAMVQIFRKDVQGQGREFDYWPDPQQVHKFAEVARGCDFVDADTLVVVGEAYGEHVYKQQKRNRRFEIFYRLSENAGEYQVAEAGLVTQSAATDVDVDALGRAMVTGYICNDVCEPEGMLWLLDEDGDLSWSAGIGLYQLEAFAPNAVRWHPRGYAVVASGGVKGSDAAFLVRAYDPFDFAPLWTYARQDPNLLNLAWTVAVGGFGEVYAGGLGANGYPAVAYVGG